MPEIDLSRVCAAPPVVHGVVGSVVNDGEMQNMPDLSPSTREALLRVGTSTLTGALHRRGLSSMFMQNVLPVHPDMPRMAGLAFTMRFIPSREDKDAPGALGRSPVQRTAMEECPPGYVLVIDSRGDARAASAGDLYVGRLKARGCAGIVTDGGLRDTEGIIKTGLPAYCQRASSPPSPIAHHPADLNLPIGCGGVAVYPGDVIVGDCDGVVVIPPDIADALAREALDTTLYEAFAEQEVARGRTLVGLFPTAGEDAKRDFEAWKKTRSDARS
jgi:regulator of RNase E activity RraA